jgi:hypothetical protein
MIGMEANLFPRVSQRTIEIFGATLGEVLLKKRRSFFPADLHPTLWSGERFFRPLKNCSLEVDYLVKGGDHPILQGVLSPKIFAGQHTCSSYKISMQPRHCRPVQ